MKAKITRAAVDALRKGQFISDTEIAGFRVRCLPSGTKTFAIQYTGKNGTRPYKKLGIYGAVTADEARTMAKKTAGLVADDRDPVAEAKADAKRAVNTVQHICEEWLRLYANGDKQLRSAVKTASVMKRHIYPSIGNIVVYDLSRADVVGMLDKIAINSGVPQADTVLGHLTGVLNWWRIRDEDFITMPVVKGMRRSDVEARKGKRALSIEEIIDVWRALDEIEPGTVPPYFAAFIRCLLLSACRRTELARMHTDEFGTGNHVGDWTIPKTRYKTRRDFLVPLPEIIRGMLPERSDGYVFSSSEGRLPFNSFSKTKQALDKAVNALRKREGRKPMPPWRLHDLRRTARSLMTSKAIGVNRDHAERVLGHIVKGVEGVYDVNDYREEKQDALVKLATFVLDAVSAPPPSGNVVKLKGRKKPTQNEKRAGLGKPRSAA